MSKNIWFKRKKYGWGWTPANAKGWIVSIIYLAALVSYSILSELGYLSFSAMTFILLAVPLTVGFIAICYFKGEKPEWRWGQKN